MQTQMGPGMEQTTELLGSLMPKRRRRRKANVVEARCLLTQEEASKLIDMESVSAEAIHRAESSGIISIDCIDEIDRVAGRQTSSVQITCSGSQQVLFTCATPSDPAARVNETRENIGARRLHTVLEKLLEDLAFEAPDSAAFPVIIDRRCVADQLAEIVADHDISRFIL
jgi:ATP-dependent protease HslVU (ClpYQ) ATPase subunit